MPLSLLWTALFAVSAAFAADEKGAVPPTGVAPLPTRCAGAAEAETPPAGTVDADALPEPWNDGFRQEYESLGYRLDPGGKRLLGRDGRPVKKEVLDWLSAPQDFSKIQVHYMDWMVFAAAGYDLDEARCVMTRDGTGDLRRVDFLAEKAFIASGRQYAELELLSARYGRRPGRLPPQARADIRTMRRLGTRLPDDLQAKVRAGSATGQDLTAAYVAQTKAFDASPERAALARAGVAAPAAAPTDAAGTPAPLTKRPEETTLSARLGQDFSALLGETQYGRDLLESFRSHGVPLPFMRLQRLAQGKGFAGAAYYSDSRSVLMDHDNAVMALMAGLPDDQKRTVAESLRTPEDLRRRLLDKPEERRKFATAILGLTFHELTHFFQSLTTHFEEESRTGNAPGGYPIEYEHEAYRETCAFMAQRSLDHEFGEAEWDEVAADRCQNLLRDYGRFADQVTRTYAQGAGATTMRDLQLMQELRRRTAQKLLPAAEEVERLRLSGMIRGDDALHQLALTIGQRTAVFQQSKLPAYRRMALEQVVPRALRTGRPDMSIFLLGAFAPTDPAFEAAATRWVADAQPSFESPGDHFPLPFRMVGYQYVAFVHQKSKSRWPEGLVRAYARDLRQYDGNPNSSWGALASMAPDQPGLQDLRAAWSDAAVKHLERPEADYKLENRLASFQVLAQSFSERRKDWPAPLMAALRRDLSVSARWPAVGGAIISLIPPGAPGRSAAESAWANAVRGSLQSPKGDFPLEWRIKAWNALGPVPPSMRASRDRDGVEYARSLLGEARRASDPGRRRSLLSNARAWAVSSAGGAAVGAEIDAEMKR